MTIQQTPPSEVVRAAPRRGDGADPEPFGPGSILWDEVGRYVSAIGGNSAFLLQTMHPAIGTVVDQLSSFRTDPVGRAQRSFASVQTWVYGGQTAIEEGKRLREMHKPLSARDEDGTLHHALSAGPWAWVHMTGYYAAITAGKYFSPEPLTPQREQLLFEEFMHLGRILRVPERMIPATVADYWTYFDDMVENTLVAHKVTRDVIAGMDEVPPTISPFLKPALVPLAMSGGRLMRFIATGTLPPVAREKLGMAWTNRDERKLRKIGQALGRFSARLPERVAYMPLAYRAREAARAQHRLESALAHRPL